MFSAGRWEGYDYNNEFFYGGFMMLVQRRNIRESHLFKSSCVGMLLPLPERHCEQKKTELVGKDVVHGHCVSSICVFVPSQRGARSGAGLWRLGQSMPGRSTRKPCWKRCRIYQPHVWVDMAAESPFFGGELGHRHPARVQGQRSPLVLGWRYGSV